MKTIPFSPPSGYYDLPYFYAYDASGLADGSIFTNQSVYIIGGYGDFLMRRVVGLNRILNPNTTGRFRIGRASPNVFMSSDPVQAENSPELAIVPAEMYRETSKIWFDLFGILKPAQPLTAQVGFQGIRRLPGAGPQIGYKAQPKSFTYQVNATLTQVASAKTPVVTYTRVIDYDFLLYQLLIFQVSNASFNIGGEGSASVTFVAVQPGSAGNNISISIPAAAGNNLPLTISVAGNVITIQLATNGGGFQTTTGTQLVAAMAANAQASALVTTTCSNCASTVPIAIGSLSGGGINTPITNPVCSINLFDQNSVLTSNLPILDIFYDGAPGSPYENGAIVPPLIYRRNTSIRIDFYSQITDPTALPTGVVIYLVGRKLYPCS